MPDAPGAGETHVWVVSTALLAPHAAALRSLSGAGVPAREAGRGFLRVLLGSYLGVRPEDVEIERRCPACGGGHGPPISGDLRISVSYTPGRVVYAFGGSAVGIDIELIRPTFAWRKLAPLVLAPEELERMHRAPPPDQAVAFLRAWTRREAIGKATGAGLLHTPSRQTVGPIRTLALELPEPYVATVALTTPRHVLRRLAPGRGIHPVIESLHGTAS